MKHAFSRSVVGRIGTRFLPAGFRGAVLLHAILLPSLGLSAGCPEAPIGDDDAGAIFQPTDSGPQEDAGRAPSDAGPIVDGGEDAGSTDDAGTDAGEPGDAGLPADGGPIGDGGVVDTAAPPRAAIFVFDQDADTLYRFIDENADGDAMDEGEMVAFFDDTVAVTGTTNSQGILTISDSEVWVTDNATPANVIRLVDENGDGDALDEGESTVLWDGTIADGGSLLLPTALARGGDGDVYLYDNNTLDKESGPEAIYRLRDDNNDGVTTEDEVDTFAILSPTGPTSTVSGFDVVVNDNGRAYYVDTQSDDDIDRVMRVSEGQEPLVYVDGAELFAATDGVDGAPGLVLSTGRPKLELADDGTQLIGLVGTFPDRGKVLVRMGDRNLSGKVDEPQEVDVLWSDENDNGPDMGTFGDFAHLTDGDIVACEAFTDRVVRLYDRNGDGDMNDPDEVVVVYDRALAAAAALPELSAPRFCHGARL